MRKILLAAAALATMSSPAFALQWCKLEVKVNGNWQEEVFADRGDHFGSRKVGKWDDWDTCRSQGRKIGPDECRAAGGSHYKIVGRKNNGTEKQETNSCG